MQNKHMSIKIKETAQAGAKLKISNSIELLC
jgi:hypothetical protein